MPARSAPATGGGGREVLSALSDDELVHRARDGDGLALEVLWQRHQTRVVKVIRSKLWGPSELAEVEDLRNEVFMKYQQSIAQYERDFPAWLSRIARNTTFDYLRKKKARPADNFTSLGKKALLQVEQASTDGHPSNDQELVRSVLCEVEKDWTGEEFIVWLDTLRGYPPREIEKFRGIPARRVSEILYRIRRKCEAVRERIEAMLSTRRPKFGAIDSIRTKDESEESN